MISDNFPNKQIQVQNDCKIAIEALLSINVCHWKAISVFQNIRSLLYSLEKVDLMWCHQDCNESTHKVVK